MEKSQPTRAAESRRQTSSTNEEEASGKRKRKKTTDESDAVHLTGGDTAVEALDERRKKSKKKRKIGSDDESANAKSKTNTTHKPHTNDEHARENTSQTKDLTHAHDHQSQFATRHYSVRARAAAAKLARSNEADVRAVQMERIRAFEIRWALRRKIETSDQETYGDKLTSVLTILAHGNEDGALQLAELGRAELCSWVSAQLRDSVFARNVPSLASSQTKTSAVERSLRKKLLEANNAIHAYLTHA